ncbi:ATPase, P-loop-containing, partial [mine drainage metagenome]
MDSSQNEILIVAGMSGAGRSTAADILEDMGWLVIDNLPSSLVEKIGDLAIRTGNEYLKIVLVLGRSAPMGFGELITA